MVEYCVNRLKLAVRELRRKGSANLTLRLSPTLRLRSPLPTSLQSFTMVPQPVWNERPAELEGQGRTISLPEHTNPEKPAEPLPFLKNTSGRFWKQPHKATLRAQSGKKDATGSSFAKREEIRKKDEAVKKLERCVRSSIRLQLSTLSGYSSELTSALII